MHQIIEVDYFGKIPFANVNITKQSTINILAQKEDEKYETSKLEQSQVSAPKYLLNLASELIANATYRPESLQNVDFLWKEGCSIEGVTNATNYGSLTAIRRLFNTYYKGQLSYDDKDAKQIWNDLYDLANQISVLGLVGYLVTPDDEVVTADRGPKVQVPDLRMPYPQGNVGYSQEFLSALWKETKEEAFRKKEEPDKLISDEELFRDCIDLNDSCLIGLTRGLTQSINPALVSRLKSRRNVKELKEMIHAAEHNPESVTGIQLAPKTFVEDVQKYWNASVDNGNGSLLLVAADFFGEPYMGDFAKQMRKEPFNAQIDFVNRFE